MSSIDIEVDGIESTKAMLETKKPDTAKYRVTADTEYAVYVEFGTRYMEAQPFMRPAVNQTMRNAGKYAEDANDTDEFVESIAEAIANKAERKAPVDTGRLQNSIEVRKL